MGKRGREGKGKGEGEVASWLSQGMDAPESNKHENSTNSNNVGILSLQTWLDLHELSLVAPSGTETTLSPYSALFCASTSIFLRLYLYPVVHIFFSVSSSSSSVAMRRLLECLLRNSFIHFLNSGVNGSVTLGGWIDAKGKVSRGTEVTQWSPGAKTH